MLLSGHSFQATLDSSEASNNDVTRGKGSYDAVINLLSVAKNCGCLDRIALRFNLSKKNVCEIESMINLATDNHMRLLNIALLNRKVIFAYLKNKTLVEFILEDENGKSNC